MADESKPVSGTRTPPAGSFETLTNFIDQFKKTPVPSQIDRSVFPSTMSGGNQSFILNSLKFLDLISSSDVPEPIFHEMVAADKDARMALWAQIVRSRYAFVFDGVDIERTTSSVVIEKFRKRNISGDTVRKAITFFLHAAKAGGVKISPHVKAPRPAPTGTRPRNKKETAAGGRSTPPAETNNTGSNTGHSGVQGETPYEMLIRILDAEMQTEEQEAVWTLIRYLKKQDANK